jgi:diguanylate cyclase (GGDEF)-like protein
VQPVDPHRAVHEAVSPGSQEEVRAGLLARSGLLDPDLGPELSRWTDTLRRTTRSSVAALAVATGDRTLIRGLSVAGVTERQHAILPPGQTLERFLTGKIESLSWPSSFRSYLEAPVEIDGHVLCTLGVVDAARRNWDQRDAQILEDVTAAVAAEIRLRLANCAAEHLHQLAASQHRVHGLIASGAPLQEVLVELTQGIERHDPSVIPSVNVMCSALERLIYDARHDGLTGLPNRTAIFDVIDDAITRAAPSSAVAVLFIDLDGLGTLNDTLGHGRADEMIREVGERLQTGVRGSDFVGRFGADEFIVVAEGVADETQAARLGLRLLEAISRPWPGIDTTVATASIGITLLSDATSDARAALRQADSAMRDAKRSGRDRVSFFGGSHRGREGRRLALVRELRGAEKRGELTIAFQPVFDLERVELVGVEALLRWNSPALGPVSPGEFIPIAEEAGLIVPIGAWVLHESCETISRIAARAGRTVELSVNLSSHQLSHPGFAKSVRHTLAHTRWPSEQLTLELAETGLVRADTIAARTLHELDSAGIRIVLDDFGTGFASLSWLKEHPIDAIKIDRGFISGLPDDSRDQVIVSSLIGLARALGCTVTAEGVENEEQLVALRLLECERVQGFLLAHPLAPDALEALLLSDDEADVTRPTGATIDLAGLRRIARIRHLREPAPGPSRRPAARRHPAGR